MKDVIISVAYFGLSLKNFSCYLPPFLKLMSNGNKIDTKRFLWNIWLKPPEPRALFNVNCSLLKIVTRV